MDLTQLADLGEFIGGVAVLVTLALPQPWKSAERGGYWGAARIC